MPYFSEMHGSKPATLVNKIFFRNITGVIAINALIEKELRETFPHSRAAYLVEPNGVDISAFAQISQQEARGRLELPAEGDIALYAGRFFAWKGLEILPEAARLTPEISWRLVGGTREARYVVQTTTNKPADCWVIEQNVPLSYTIPTSLLSIGWTDFATPRFAFQMTASGSAATPARNSCHDSVSLCGDTKRTRSVT